MKKVVSITLICLLVTWLQAFSSEQNLPLIGGKATVATVNDEPITLEEVNSVLGAAHAARFGEKKAGRIDYSSIINRLINTRLIVLEGRNIGFDELPETKKAVRNYAQQTLMELLMERHVEGIEPNQEEITTVYEEIAEEWKIASVSFETEEAVKKFDEQIKSGKSFEETVKWAMAKGLTKDVSQAEYLKDRELTLPIAQLVSEMEIGSVSPIVAVNKNNFLIFKLEGRRIPAEEDPEAMQKARRQARTQKKVQAARKYYEELREKYVKINEELFESLDYESAQPGFESLLKDERVIAEVIDGEPITVKEFSEALKQNFFHGVEKAIESKRINEKKNEVLEEIIQKRILLKEAYRRNIDKFDEYRKKVKEYENSLIFGLFIKRVIQPDIKLNVKELKNYYQENNADYSSPEMMRIKGIVFGSKSRAVDALDKLLQGTDFNWLSSNAEGQVGQEGETGLRFDGKLVTSSSLPEGVSRAVSGAKSGDFRLYESDGGYFYVLYIYQVIPAKPKPFAEVQQEVAKKVYQDKVNKAVEEYANKLKEYYPVKIYAKDLQ